MNLIGPPLTVLGWSGCLVASPCVTVGGRIPPAVAVVRSPLLKRGIF